VHVSTDVRELPVWRSILFVPAVSDRFVESALKGPADALQIDLEDSVGPAQKDEARARVAAIADRFAAAGRDVTVRVNRPWRMLVRDLEATVRGSVKAIAMPKVPDASFVRELAEVLAGLERERGLPVGHTRIITMIEDAQGLAQLDDIAAAHSRVVGQIIGGEDLAASLGSTVDDDAMYVPNVQNVRAARRAGVLPIGFIGSVADYRDADAFRARIVRARRLGFEGAFCIHPSQVVICNTCFAPDPAEVVAAREMLEAFEREVDAGRAAFEWKGRMVDLPIVERARSVLRRQQAIDAKTARAG
jgi:citrate lyase subunit beta/citryl-CoA lyase